MTSQAFSQRPGPARSATWPSTEPQPSQSTTISTSTNNQAFQDDLEQHPERHFLSPMAVDECYGWDSDSDSDGDDDGEWHAGITDFSLFVADRKRAMESGQPLDGKWDAFVTNQAEAFGRSVERVREGEEVPGLTPDSSPNLRDDLEDEAEAEAETEMELEERMLLPQIRVPDYLTVEVKPSESTDGRGGAVIGPDDTLPMSFRFARQKRVARPGLLHARTMSGRRHVWRRPGEEMFTVGEDVDAEAEAERAEDELRLVASTGALERGA